MISYPSQPEIPAAGDGSSSWSLAYDGFKPEQEGLRETLCTLGNGFFATRGARPEAVADNVHYPGTYLAGGYNRLQTTIAGRVIENEDLVNFPNWLPLSFRIDGESWFDLVKFELLVYRQVLDLQQGVLLHTIRFRDGKGRITLLRSRRLVHMRSPHYAALEMTLTPENWSGPLEIRTALDGRVINGGVERYRQLGNTHLEPVAQEPLDEETIFLQVQTSQSRLYAALTARTRVFQNSHPLALKRSVVAEPGYIGQQLSIHIGRGQELRLEKVVALYTSGDQAIAECGLEAEKASRRAGSFAGLLASHSQAWSHLWRLFDIEIKLDDPKATEETAMILRLHVFHLLQTASVSTMDLDAGIPARGWHGEAYRGHVFWDEMFVFPLLNFRVPEITRALLRYRYRRLNEARAAAAGAGYRGAMFPWQSGSDGREESQELHLNPKSGRWLPDNTRLQRHVNATIAYNIWQYYQVTLDMEFLSFYGAEMILEIARFWASIATYNPDLDRYEILGVMGPDEYHDHYPGADGPGLNNNAYTNVMAVWVLCCALDLLDLLTHDRRQELCERLDLGPDEMRHWREVSTRMRVIFHEDGIISQFEGYEQLAEFDWEGYRRKYGNIQRLDRILEAEGDSPNAYKASKQADVLMLFYLFSSEELGRLFRRLGYPFAYETIPRNIEYYLGRTSHGSTLSRVVHSWVLARSDRPASWRQFSEALHSDLQDVQGGTTPEGIHLGAMAGSVDLIKRGYTGTELRGNVLWFNPSLPAELTDLRMRLRYRGHALDLHVSTDRLRIAARKCEVEPVRIGFKDKTHVLHGGETLELTL
ncbi:MAG: glycoside hydrolase family 65 protein [Desulfobacteraceae bacterium]|nr:glycoside hydrolase family 65 protein [Desulfobacteraceae bacterium]